MDLRKVGAVLAVAGLLLLPAPAYAVLLADTPNDGRTAARYVGGRIDPPNGTGAAWPGGYTAVSTARISSEHHDHEFRAPETTRRTVRRGILNGSATVEDADARADLRTLADHYFFVYTPEDDREQFYRFDVADNGSVIRTEAVTVETVVNTTTRGVLRYEELSPAERRTADRIIANSSEEGYAPRADVAFTDEIPTLLVRDGSLYYLAESDYSEGVGRGFGAFLYGIRFVPVGAALTVIGGALFAVGYYRR